MDSTQLAKILIQECHLDKKKTLLVGVSGGPDSLCLLHLLYSLEYKVVVGHINHQLRLEAKSEAESVQKFCTLLQIPFFYQEVDVPTFAEKRKLSLEEGARLLRYTCLMEMADKVDAQALAVAHQADDQIETVLMHLLRGSGMAGLKGMTYRSISAFSKKIPVVRPLLGVWRHEILEYCQENGIAPSFDASNADRTYFRNRIRHELIPELNTYNDQASQHLWQLSRIAGEEERFLSAQTDQMLKLVVRQRGPGFVMIDRVLFAGVDVVLQRRMARLFLAGLRDNLRDIGLDAVERMIDFLARKDSHGEWQILDQIYLTAKGREEAFLYSEQAELGLLWPLLPQEDEIGLVQLDEFFLNPHWKLLISYPTPDEIVWNGRDPAFAFFDADLLPGALTLGRRKAGERFAPFGMAGHTIKLGDYFTNNHYPRQAREKWPILRAGGTILWLVGLRRGQPAPLTADTHHVLAFHLVKVD